MKKYLFLQLFSLSIYGLYGQVTPSPAAMGTIAGTQEDLYKGAVTEVVPIFNLPAGGGHTVPIQLVYQTKAIRVDQEAGPVGLGWDMVAGGTITRVMRDEPDEQSTFQNSVNPDILRDKELGRQRGYDFQKDIFYYSCPGGSGRFINSANTMTGAVNSGFTGLPYTDWKIQFYYTSTSNSYWKLTDINGVEYIFGKESAARETTNIQTYDDGETPKGNQRWSYISTWYLEEIIYPNFPAPNKVTFIYKKNALDLVNSTYTSTKKYNQTVDKYIYRYYAKHFDAVCQNCFRKSINGNPSTIYYDPIQPYYNKKLFDDYGFLNTLHHEVDHEERAYPLKEPVLDQIYGEKKVYTDVNINTSYLERISTKMGSATFSYGSRVDVDGVTKVDKIVISNTDAKDVWVYDLHYEYFDANSADGPCTNPKECKRLKLKSINKNGLFYRDFAYINEDSPHLELPSKKSDRVDFLGFYNKDVESKFAKVRYLYDEDLPVILSVDDDWVAGTTDEAAWIDQYAYVNIAGSNRSTNGYAKANLLSTIKYPTGGKKKLTYSHSGVTGVVISSINTYDELSNLVFSTNYFFSEPQKRSTVYYIAGGESTYVLSDPNSIFDYNNFNGFRVATRKDNLTGNTTSVSFNTVNHASLDKEVRPLDNWDFDDPVEAWNWFYIREALMKISGPYISYPYVNPAYSMIWHTVVRDSFGQFISIKDYRYSVSEEPSFITERAFYNVDDNIFIIASSKISDTPVFLDYIEETSFEGGERLVTRTDYTYHESHPTFVSDAITENLQSNIQTKISNRYVFDITTPFNEGAGVKESYAYLKMHKNRIWSTPIEELTYYKPSGGTFKIVGGKLRTFQSFTNFVAPYINYTLSLSSPASSHTAVNVGASPGYSFIKDSDYELSKVYGFSPEENIMSVTGRDNISTIYTYNNNNSLITSETTEGLTTTYQHIPLVGVSKITDPNGKSTTYEYDPFNRLKLIRDHDGNILERYRYHYKGQDERLSAEIGISGEKKRGVILTFSAENVASCYGKTRFIWDFGDGTVEEASKPGTTYHHYSSAGTYTVKLSVVNPEYEPSSVYTTETITVKGNFSFQICSTFSEFYQSAHRFCTLNLSCFSTGSHQSTFVGFSGGTGSHCGLNDQYLLYYQLDGSSDWIFFDNAYVATIDYTSVIVSTPGTHKLKMVITDDCGFEYDSNILELVVHPADESFWCDEL